MKIYNTLTRKKEDFKPIQAGKVLIYVCGPTVYNYIHIGNSRPMIVYDTLRRYLLYIGYDVKFVSNFTDIDDKIINRAKDENVPFTDITKKYIDAYLEDSYGLNLFESHTIHPKATECIDEMIEFVKVLEEKGIAYNVDGNVYFDITKAKDYGKLSKKNIDDLRAGARIDISDEKKNPLDFALWKKRKDETEPAWESPWGMGRPGWHLECSVMAKKFLGDTIDIHAGGEDLQFPHHENEIAQSECCNGKVFANYWMHNGMINIDNVKMSKSKGNFFTIKDIQKEYDLEVIRLWILSTHYRNPLNFSREVMEQTKNGLERMYNGKEHLERLLEICEERENADVSKLLEFKKEFLDSMDDDLNTADAISKVYELIRYTNTFDENTDLKLVKGAVKLLSDLTSVLGLLYKEEDDDLDEKVEKLIEEREEARKNKDFKRADEIRDTLKEMNIELKDTRNGVIWKRV
ncbi:MULTISPECIES: cysteine--tRNA ligase [unclassified Parvimonas]|jgi:cysteine--tRNA ligase|uniref:cysteine--tRNA ligase n=1 Tax=unclassified Parvimonas TaxID=1151464 RepID=UPI002B466089|nr:MULTISPECIES: cysteine--tRNA ligase [unclassified Parvimonas]MEB3024511.1 cysteine--tRNA ligase [Parvimonas sp. M13]MEB3072556.1 cysteine--tRNA ligase [Parvimonas sp. C2]MEB3088659.1 cysteine--tRNA ligase [Parvimonas sp. M20]